MSPSEQAELRLAHSLDAVLLNQLQLGAVLRTVPIAAKAQLHRDAGVSDLLARHLVRMLEHYELRMRAGASFEDAWRELRSAAWLGRAAEFTFPHQE